MFAGSIVDKVAFFRECDHRFFQRIVRSLEPATFAPNELVMKEGEPGSKLYIISKGVVELLHGEELKRVDTRADGAHFGMISIVEKGPSRGKRVCSVRTLTYCDFRTISKRAFNRGLRRYPEVKHDVNRLVGVEYVAFEELIRKAAYMEAQLGTNFGKYGEPNHTKGLRRTGSTDSMVDEPPPTFTEDDVIDPGGRSESETSIPPDSPTLRSKSSTKSGKAISLSNIRRHSDMRRGSSFNYQEEPKRKQKRASDFRDIIEEHEEDEDEPSHSRRRTSSMDAGSANSDRASPTTMFTGPTGGMTIEQTEQMSQMMVRLEIFLDEQETKKTSSVTRGGSSKTGLRSVDIDVLDRAIDEEEAYLQERGIVLSTGEVALPPPPLEKRKEELEQMSLQ